MPSREPDYRSGESTQTFSRTSLSEAATRQPRTPKEWQAVERGAFHLAEQLVRLLRLRYTNPDWNYRR